MRILSNTLLFVICFGTFSVYATETNINEVTDLFERHIDNKDELFQEMEQQNKNAYENIKQQKDFQLIPGMDAQESEAARVSNISEHDLENEGRKIRHSDEMRFYDDNELEPDYSKPGNKAHFDDMADIAAALDRKLVNILALLKKEMNVDCETVKGPIEKEPVHYIEMQREVQQNTEYDQMLCEEPRKGYVCRDHLSLRCKRRGMRWNPWQARTITMVHNTMPRHWWRSEPYYYHSNKDNDHYINSTYHNEIEQEIARQIGVLPEQIYLGPQDIRINKFRYRTSLHRNVDISNCTRWYTLLQFGRAIITFHYQYRDGYEICAEWQEIWTERCDLK